MSEQLTTYTVKSRSDGFVMVFKYHLSGELYSFELLEGALREEQKKWLYEAGNFPHSQHLLEGWTKTLKKHFEITVGLPQLTFEAFWGAYGLKTRKKETEASWNRLSEADRFKALEGIRRYNNHLRLNTWKNKLDPIRYLKQRRWEDEL